MLWQRNSKPRMALEVPEDMAMIMGAAVAGVVAAGEDMVLVELTAGEDVKILVQLLCGGTSASPPLLLNYITLLIYY